MTAQNEEMLTDGPPTTVKVPCVQQLDEKEQAQKEYEDALELMLREPTIENIKAFTNANAHLFEVEDLYRIALKLLTERARKLKNAVFTR